MASLAECDEEYARMHKKCTKYICDYQNLQGKNTGSAISDNYAFDSGATRCYVGVPKAQSWDNSTPATTVPEAITYGGAPVDSKMDSFFQPFKDCEWDADLQNDALKQRIYQMNYGNNHQPFPYPPYKQCEPSQITLERKGNPQSIDGLINPSLSKVRNVQDESALVGLTTVLGNSDTVLASKRPLCSKNALAARSRPDEKLQELYESTAIDGTMFLKQLQSDYENSKNSNTAKPFAFNNCSKSKMNTNVMSQ